MSTIWREGGALFVLNYRIQNLCKNVSIRGAGQVLYLAWQSLFLWWSTVSPPPRPWSVFNETIQLFFKKRRISKTSGRFLKCFPYSMSFCFEEKLLYEPKNVTFNNITKYFAKVPVIVILLRVYLFTVHTYSVHTVSTTCQGAHLPSSLSQGARVV